jgi:hypothetical protein
MKTDRLWIALAGVAVGALVMGWAPLGAQRVADPRPADAAVGRFQVVRVVDQEIVLLDTTTGDLYAAGPNDVKPHTARPQVADGRPFARPSATTTRTTTAKTVPATRRSESMVTEPKTAEITETTKPEKK